MGEWIYRPNQHEDWISLVFFIVLMVLLALFKLDSDRFKTLLNFLNPRVYFGKYSNEKDHNYFTYFNLSSFFLIVTALSLSCFSFSIYSSSPLRFGFEFVYLALGLSFILVVRHLAIQFISAQLGFKKFIYSPVYKNFTIATQHSFFLIVLIFIWNYSTLPKLFSESLIAVVGLSWLINLLLVLFSFFRSHQSELVYIILYLCTFKIAPWIWVYFIFIETKL